MHMGSCARRWWSVTTRGNSMSVSTLFVGFAPSAWCTNWRRSLTSCGGTHSDIGRDCRHALLGLARTCGKLGIALWDLGARLGVCGSPSVPQLADLIRYRGQPA